MGKFITCFIVSFLFLGFSLEAQDQFRLGLHGGGYYSQAGDGIKLSVTGEIPFNHFISIRPELSFVKKPFEHDLATLDPEKEYILTFQHGFEMVVPIKFRFDFSKWNFFGAIGPYGTSAFELKGYLVKEAGGQNFRKERIAFEDARLQPYDIGVSIGGGVEKTIANNKRIVLQAYKNWGLIDIDNQPDGVSFTENLVIMLGITIPLGKAKK
ncbi:MAG: PorT family protein [Saprospiraceae bacterium]|nr:PorT family protein [Saprospiraceae bacterium]